MEIYLLSSAVRFTLAVIIFSHCFIQQSNAATKVLNLEIPRIGVYRKNYRDDITQIIAEGENTEVTLPILKYEDHTWEGKSIQLVCNASYPIVWKYNGHGAPAVHTLTYRKLVSDVDLTYQFMATVVFTHTNAKQTGNYTCESVQNPATQHSYVYLFVPGDALFLTDIEETETVIIKYNESWVTLPCSVSDSDVTAILFKKQPEGTAEILKTNENLIYDSKIGFQMRWRAFGKPIGTYFCVAQNKRNIEQLEIELEFPHKPEQINLDASKTPYWSKPFKRQSVRFIPDQRGNRIVCCSKSNQRPIMKSTGCSSTSDCEIRRKYLENKKCPPTCEQHIVNVGKTCVAYQLGDWHDNGLLQCSLNDSSTSSSAEYFIFSKHSDQLMTNFDEVPPVNQILKIFIDDSPNPGKIYISCHAHPFFFSHGLKWGVKKPNGEFEFLPETHFPAPTNIEIEKNKNIGNEYFCFAPIWNSPNDWRNTAILIK